MVWPYNTDGAAVDNDERLRAIARAYDQADWVILRKSRPLADISDDELRKRFANIELEWLRQWKIATDAKSVEEVRQIKEAIRCELWRRGIVV